MKTITFLCIVAIIVLGTALFLNTTAMANDAGPPGISNASILFFEHDKTEIATASQFEPSAIVAGNKFYVELKTVCAL